MADAEEGCDDYADDFEEVGDTAVATVAAPLVVAAPAPAPVPAPAPAPAPAAAPAPAPRGGWSQIDPHSLSLGRALGGGGFAVVCEAVWKGGERVAVKRIVDPRTSAAQRAAFEAELTALASFGTHANLVRLLGACLHPQLFVLEYLSGGTLTEALARGAPPRGAPWPLATVLSWGADVASGLAHLHGLTPTPLLHRDIKPANVLLRTAPAASGAPPSAVLADFGLAGCGVAGAGTPSYMAPELLTAATGGGGGGAFARASDVYSLGITLWALLSGEEPWRGWSVDDISRAVLTQRTRPDLSRLRGDTPAGARTLIASAWAHEPGARPTAATVAATLRQLATDAAASASTLLGADGDALDDALGKRGGGKAPQIGGKLGARGR